MQLRILDPQGLPILCACGQPATIWVLNTLGKPVYYCPAHDPSGQPCPLCGGSGKIQSRQYR